MKNPAGETWQGAYHKTAWLIGKVLGKEGKGYNKSPVVRKDTFFRFCGIPQLFMLYVVMPLFLQFFLGENLVTGLSRKLS